MSKTCSVYIVGHEHATFGHAVKVGLSDNVASRVSQLQTASAEELRLYYAVELPDRRSAEIVEHCFHEIFCDFCIRGEWFGMPPGRAMFMLGNILGSEVYLGGRAMRLGPIEAFSPFHDADYDTQADWVNDWARREEEAYECQ